MAGTIHINEVAFYNQYQTWRPATAHGDVQLWRDSDGVLAQLNAALVGPGMAARRFRRVQRRPGLATCDDDGTVRRFVGR
jgi:hypothetical protein